MQCCMTFYKHSTMTMYLYTMYKIVNHQIYYPPDAFVPRVTSFLPSSYLLYQQPFCRYLYSFVPKSMS